MCSKFFRKPIKLLLSFAMHTDFSIDFLEQIENQKLEFKASSKVGSLDNVKYKPGGGDIKIFDDKEYIKQIGAQSPAPSSHTHSRQEVRPD